ncbi:MAG: AraC family transcriptional regulator [Candidatus Vecturithrix sp.]|jgi:AraC-like DNA-binding protein|nr:AraC family transcriptional regulator [Candidatus Vecturithrix sp.]
MKYDHYVIEQPRKWEHTWVYRPFEEKRYNYPLLLKMIGYARWASGESYSRKNPKIFFVEYVRAGNVRLVEDGKEYLVEPGEVYLLHKGLSHTYATGPADVVLKRFVQIGGSGLYHYLRTLGLTDQIRIRLHNPRAFERLFKHAVNLFHQVSAELDRQMDIQLSCLAYQMLLELSLSVQQPMPIMLERALAFMHQHLHESLTRDDICGHVGLSAAYFNRLFSEHMRCTPIAYFLRQKFNWAAQLLTTTALSVKEVAYRTGFDDPLYFSSQFKKHFGISPIEYRKQEEQSAAQERRRTYHPCSR